MESKCTHIHLNKIVSPHNKAYNNNNNNNYNYNILITTHTLWNLFKWNSDSTMAQYVCMLTFAFFEFLREPITQFHGISQSRRGWRHDTNIMMMMMMCLPVPSNYIWSTSANRINITTMHRLGYRLTHSSVVVRAPVKSTTELNWVCNSDLVHHMYIYIYILYHIHHIHYHYKSMGHRMLLLTNDFGPDVLLLAADAAGYGLRILDL